MKRLFTFLLLLVAFTPLLHSQGIHYVSPGASGQNDGTSWTDAFTSLQSALQAAVGGDAIWVAQGVYHATAGTDRTAHFQLPSGVKLYGGFSGVETSPEERELPRRQHRPSNRRRTVALHIFVERWKCHPAVERSAARRLQPEPDR